jgi:hypothetical protein
MADPAIPPIIYTIPPIKWFVVPKSPVEILSFGNILRIVIIKAVIADVLHLCLLF